MPRKILLLLFGNASSSLILLVRNILVAHLLPVEEFGIASVFIMVTSIAEMSSNIGLQQQIVQSGRGDEPEVQAALQAFQVLRGLLAALAIAVLAGPLARAFGIPDTAGTLRILAAVPLINALVHFDIYRLNRHMSFGPGIVSTLVPSVVSVSAVFVLSRWLHDNRLMLWVILVHSLTMTVTSHLVARRAYRLRLDWGVMRAGTRFGWPLLINSVLLLAAFQGEKMVVAANIGMAALAIFSMGFTLTLTPTLVIAKSVQTFFLPQLSRSDDDSAEFASLSIATIQGAVLNAVVVVTGAVLLGPLLVHLLLGPDYALLAELIGVFAVLQGARVLKTGYSVVALSRGNTANAMLSNLPRLVAVAVVFAATRDRPDLELILLVGILSEVAGTLIALVLLVSTSGLGLWACLRPLLVSVPVLGLGMLPWLRGGIAPLGTDPAALTYAGAAVVMLAACVTTSRELLGRLFSRHRRKG